MMESVLGTTPPVFVGVSVLLMGFAASMTGQAVATTWKPAWHLVVYTILLAAGSRFLIFSLFGGELLSLTGYLADVAVLVSIGLLSFRISRAGKMVSQYPWLYERAGPFSWREKSTAKTS